MFCMGVCGWKREDGGMGGWGMGIGIPARVSHFVMLTFLNVSWSLTDHATHAIDTEIAKMGIG